MKKSNKKYTIIVLLVLLLALAVGYAFFSETLTITGTANANGTFDLQFENASVVSSEGVKTTGEGEVTGITISSDKNTATVKVVDLAYPKAGAQFHVDVKNVGTVDAKLIAVNKTGTDDPVIQVKFPDLTAGEENGEIIKPGKTCGIDFTVEWADVDTKPSAEGISFEITLDYEQATTAFSGSAAHDHVE